MFDFDYEAKLLSGHKWKRSYSQRMKISLCPDIRGLRVGIAIKTQSLTFVKKGTVIDMGTLTGTIATYCGLTYLVENTPK